MSKRAVGIILALALVTFGLVYYLSRPSENSAILARSVAVPKALVPEAVAKPKSVGVARVQRKKPVVRKGFSAREYASLKRRYKSPLITASGPLNAYGLKTLARGKAGAIIEGRRLLPVVKDVIYGRTVELENKLAAGLNPNAFVVEGFPIDSQVSLLDIAIEAGQRNVINLLLSLNASVNPPADVVHSTFPRFEGPLALAARDNENDVIRLLLERGANVNQRLGVKVDNQTALEEAMGSPSTVYLLLTHGADPNSVLGPGGSVPRLLIDFNPPRWAVEDRKLLVQYGLKIPAGH